MVFTCSSPFAFLWFFINPGELGDHEAHIGTDYLSELRLAPNQPEELKQVIARIHREELR